MLSAYRTRCRHLRIQLALFMLAAGFGLSRATHGGGWLWAAAAICFAVVAGYTLTALQNNRRAYNVAQILTGHHDDADQQR